MIEYVLAALLALATPWNRWVWTSDRRQFDDERYTEYCVGQYQIPETWTCVSVSQRQTVVRLSPKWETSRSKSKQ